MTKFHSVGRSIGQDNNDESCCYLEYGMIVALNPDRLDGHVAGEGALLVDVDALASL